MSKLLFIAAVIGIILLAINKPDAVDKDTLDAREKRRLKLKKKD